MTSPVNEQGYAPEELSLPEALAGLVAYKAHGRGVFDEDVLDELSTWAPDAGDMLMASMKGVTWPIDTWFEATGTRTGAELAQAVHQLLAAHEFPVAPSVTREELPWDHRPVPTGPKQDALNRRPGYQSAIDQLSDRYGPTRNPVTVSAHLLPDWYLERLTPQPAQRGGRGDDGGLGF